VTGRQNQASMDAELASSRGLPLILELRSTVDRSRVAVGGTVVSVAKQREGALAGYRCVLDDGTGQIDLFFLGRREVPGLGVGARCHVEGTARMDRGRLTIWNPLYRLEPTSCDG
jgi:hypothetical protein